MSKKHAHIIFLVFDVLSIAAVLWAVFYIFEKYDAVYSSQSIEYEPLLTYLLLLIFLPAFHAMTFVEHLNRIRPHVGKLLIGSSALLISLKIFINYDLNRHFKEYGYTLCKEEVGHKYKHETYKKNCN